MENTGDVASGNADTVECPYCAERIAARAKKCRYCGETIDVAMRAAEQALRASERSGNVYMNAASSAAVAAPAVPAYVRPPKSRAAAILLALFLGGFGAHKFYLGSPGLGILYLLFFWTFIPAVVAFIEMIIYIFTSDYDFHRKYG